MTEDQLGSSAVESAVQPPEAQGAPRSQEKAEQIPAPALEDVLVAKTGLAGLMEFFPQSAMTPEIEKVIQIAAEQVAKMESALNRARVEAGFPSLNELISKMAENQPSTTLYGDTSGNLTHEPIPPETTAGRLA